jgi:hypothetical protein
VSLLAESCPLSGAAVAPPLLSVLVPVLPVVEPLSVDELSLLESDDDELESLELLSLDVLESLLELLLSFADAASVGDWADCGIVTSAGGPGTCAASVSPPPQPAAPRASRPAATSAMMRPGM